MLLLALLLTTQVSIGQTKVPAKPAGTSKPAAATARKTAAKPVTAKTATASNKKVSANSSPAQVKKSVWRTSAMDEAMSYYTSLKYREAYQKFREAMAQGDKDALYFIGRMHQYRELKYDSVKIDTIRQIEDTDEYFEADRDSATYYYKKAVDEGSLLGHLGLAEQTIVRSNDDKRRFMQHMRTAAIVIREKAVEGDAFSNRILGSMYYTGFGEMVDKGLAFNYLSKAAEANDVNSYASLANLYLNGEGVKKDYDKAVYWLNKGVQAGEREALYTMGLLKEEGTLGEVKIEEARGLYRKAVSKGSVLAYDQLKYINQTPDQKVVIAAVTRDPDMLKRALNAGGDVNTLAMPDDFATDLRGRTPLMHTIYIPLLLEDYGVTYEPEVRVKTVSMLLSKGANINDRDVDGKTALHYLVSSARIRSELYEQEQVDLLDMLLRKGANPNIRDNEGNTVLAKALQATIGQHIGIMELGRLLDAGAKPNARNNEGKTPLILACEMNANSEVIVALIQAGADPKMRDVSGKAAIDYTSQENVQNVLMAAGSPEKQK
ncbi:ankyrin repeat domain-containing protein [Pontibacter sp. MBLB2868]|uniref:ankyrin repeat domain-containing protein n=1 Tax=Pontibacter sp. MBLB2868 TaxID=3451555 RepID=UPI003F74F2A4